MSDHKLQFRIAVADLAAIDAARLELGLERTSFFRERPEAREMLTSSLHNRASGARTTVSISVDEGTEAKFKQLQEAGLNIVWREYAKVHTIDGERELGVIREFVEAGFPAGTSKS